MLCDVDHEIYLRAMDLFLALINEPGLFVVESKFYDLEAVKIVFVKSRNPDDNANIVPRVNLPFLFLYPRVDSHVRCREYCP